MVNMSAKFDKEICNGLVSIVFTRSAHGRTEGRNHARTDGTTAALLYPHRNALRGDIKFETTTNIYPLTVYRHAPLLACLKQTQSKIADLWQTDIANL